MGVAQVSGSGESSYLQPLVPDPSILTGHTRGVYSLASIGRRLLASDSANGAIRLWDIENEIGAGILTTASVGGTKLASIGGEILATVFRAQPCKVALWNVEERSEIGHFSSSPGISSIASLGEGRLATGLSGKIDVWDVERKMQVGELRGHDTSSSVDCLAHVEKDLFASWARDHTVRLWDARQQSEVGILHKNVRDTYFLYGLTALGSNLLAGGYGEGSIRLWDIRRLSEVSVLTGHKDGVHGLAQLEGGALASSGRDATVRLWDVGKQREIALLTGHTDVVWDVAALESGRLASCSSDTTIRVWDLSTSLHSDDCQNVGRESYSIDGEQSTHPSDASPQNTEKDDRSECLVQVDVIDNTSQKKEVKGSSADIAPATLIQVQHVSQNQQAQQQELERMQKKIETLVTQMSEQAKKIEELERRLSDAKQ